MEETNESLENSGVEPVEQPVGADKGDNVLREESQGQTSWVTGEIAQDARMLAMFCHLAGVVGLSPLLPGIGGIVVPFVIWQIKKEQFPFVDEQGKEAVNFQMSMLLYALIGSAVCAITCVGWILIPFVLGIVGVVDLVFLLIAAFKANSGRHYRYPLTIRFIK